MLSVPYPVRVVLWKPETPHLFDDHPMFSGATEKISDALIALPIVINTVTVVLPLREKPGDIHETVRSLLLERLGLGKEGWEIKSVSPPDEGDAGGSVLRYARLANAARLRPRRTPGDSV